MIIIYLILEICEAVCVEWSTCIDGNCICDSGYQMHKGHCQGMS